MKLRAVIFDYNGTLLDDIGLAFGAVQEIFERYNLPAPTLDQYRNEITSNYMEFYWQHGIPRKATKDDLNKIRNEYINSNWNSVGFRPGTEDCLKRCNQKGYQVAIVSAEVDALLRRRLNDAGLTHCFHIIKAEAWPKEPALRETIAKLNLEPKEAVYVDDTHEGISSARGLGMKTVAITAGYGSLERLVDAKPDMIIHSLSQLFIFLAETV